MGVAVALIAVFMATISALPPASATTLVVPAAADTFVLSVDPDATRGGSDYLRISGTAKVSYLRFDVPTPPSGELTITATLQVYAFSKSRCDLGVDVFRAASDTWMENTTTWADQPGTVGQVLDTATWSAEGYQSFDVTAAVTEAGPASFLLRYAPGCDETSHTAFASRDGATNQPRLTLSTSVAADPACSDGADDDFDGLIDFPADPGCTDPSDDDETDAPATGESTTVVAAGDIVCDPSSGSFDGTNPAVCQHAAAADLLAGADAVLPLGDLQYPDGTLAQFMTGYDLSWGRYAAVTYPAVGNHEYHVAGAAGYFDYWNGEGRTTGGTAAGYYSYDLGPWHMIALNSASGCCAEGSAQNDFLEQDLASTSESCIAAYWHHPLFNSGTVHGDSSSVRPLWDDLYAAGADIVLTGHEHNYQRYAKQNPQGEAVPDGIRQFVVGTGGKSHYGLSDMKDANFEFGSDTDFGVLRLQLFDGSYSWEFVDIEGAVLDSGGPVPCN